MEFQPHNQHFNLKKEVEQVGVYMVDPEQFLGGCESEDSKESRPIEDAPSSTTPNEE
jgi:hypothetical protein